GVRAVCLIWFRSRRQVPGMVERHSGVLATQSWAEAGTLRARRVSGRASSIPRAAAAVLCLSLLAARPAALPQEQEIEEPPPPVQAADLPTVLEVEVVGNRRYGDEQLADLLGAQVGRPLDPQAIASGLRELGETYRVRGQV